MGDFQSTEKHIKEIEQIVTLNIACLLHVNQLLESIRQRSWAMENKLNAEIDKRQELEQLANQDGIALTDTLEKEHNDL